MGINYNPSIVRSGLVLCLDAANSKSYPGTGTSWADMVNLQSFSSSGAPVYNSAGYFTFNGTTDYFSNTTLNSFSLNTSTTSYAIYPTYSVSGGQRVNISYRSGNGGRMYIGTTSGLLFSYYDSLSTPGYSIGAVTANSWNICTVVTDSVNNILSHYVNGVLAGTVSRTNFNAVTKSDLFLGYDPGGTSEYFQGRISQVMVYSRVLSAAEILQNYNASRARYGL